MLADAHISSLGYLWYKSTQTLSAVCWVVNHYCACSVFNYISNPRPSRLRDRAAMAGKGTVQNYDGDGNGNVKKAIGLMSKTTTLHVHHAFL